MVLSCFISFSPLCALALFHLSSSHDSSFSQRELVLVSPILNIQTHKTPFSHSCLSSYSHFPFKCEHIKAQMHLLCGVSLPIVDVINSLPRSLVSSSLPSIGMRTSSLQSVILQHNYISLSKSCPSSVSVTLSSMVLLPTSCFTVSFKGSASFPRQVSENLLNASYSITFCFFYVVITCKYSCSYHIFVAISQIYLAMYGTISFTPCPYMTLTNKSLLSIWPNYFVAE